METWHTAAIWAVTAVLFYFSEQQFQRMIRDRDPGRLRALLSPLPGALVRLLLAAVVCRLQLPLLTFDAGLLVSYLLSARPLRRASGLLFCFWTSLCFLWLTGLHLLFLTGYALAAGVPLAAGYEAAFLPALAAALFFSELPVFMLRSGAFSKMLRLLSRDISRFRLVVGFQCFAVVYVLCDTSAFLAGLSNWQLSLLILSSTALILALFVIVVHFAYQGAAKANLQWEFHQLEAEQAAYQEEARALRRMAYIDQLTGATTRRYAIELLEALVHEGHPVTISFVDVNGLKAINDQFGHQAGDELLRLIAGRLRAVLLADDVLARMGGDEFLIITQRRSKQELEQALSALNAQLSAEPRPHSPASFSFGAAASTPEAPLDVRQLLSESDSHMYDMKRRRTGGAL